MLASSDPIFSSVFPATILDQHTTPTPVATPELAFTSAGQSFGAGTSPIGRNHHLPHHQPLTSAQLHVKRSTSWSTATRFLSLASLSALDFENSTPSAVSHRIKTRDVDDAIEFLLSTCCLPGQTDEEWDLVEWYTRELRTHFQSHVMPGMRQAWSAPIPLPHAMQSLRGTAQRLSVLQSAYEAPIVEHILPAVGGSNRRNTLEPDISAERRRAQIVERVQRRIHALFLHALPVERLAQTISHVTFDYARQMFQIDVADTVNARNVARHHQAENELMVLLDALRGAGMGGGRAKVAFAHAMNKLMNDFVNSHWMKVDWETGSSVIPQLRKWVKHGLAPFVRTVVFRLTGGSLDASAPPGQYFQPWLDVAVTRLGHARIANLFDYVVKWDHSFGAILDIKEYIVGSEARTYLTTQFSQQVSGRLLHAGATSTHILNMYISIIRVFSQLDPKGVLLDKVARPIRRYLRDREDTAHIIVASLLAEVEDQDGNTSNPSVDISLEIAKEMLNPITGFDEQDKDMDWDNMDWTPDPHDAAPEFRKSKAADVIGALLSLYNREEFINELRIILGEHLLKNEGSRFEKEERLLELFKHRLGDDKLQACEVMLHDVQQSRRMNGIIRHLPAYKSAVGSSKGLELNAQILSKFFWPELKDDSFAVPASIKRLQDEYEKGFESIKDMRKLEWYSAIGRVTVELEFEDRTMEETVPTWAASVIYAFQAPDRKTEVEKSVAQLVGELSMEETLVRNALVFWVGKHVLRARASSQVEEKGGERYRVIERLSTFSDAEDTAAEAAQAVMDADEAVSAVKSQAEMLKEKEPLYRQFIVGMLTNQGNLPLARIWMMLKVMIPEGFGFGVEEVRSLLDGLEVEGKVVGQGDVWAVRRD